MFAGGTAIVLTHGEYRESVDMDFLCSNLAGYRKLREELGLSRDLKALCRENASIAISREIRADQYGIRTMLDIGGVDIKFEIVFEGRISLDSPAKKYEICGVSTLTPVDMAATKLLANSDRWVDDSVFSRDLIDLAMLNLSSEHLEKALHKASEAYGKAIKRDLNSAIEKLKNSPDRLEDCMEFLQIRTVSRAKLWEKIRRLKQE